MKWLLRRFLQLRVITCIICALCLLAVIELFIFYGEYNYQHIPEEEIENELYRATNPQLVKKSNVECNYDEMFTTKGADSWNVDTNYDDFLPTGIVNGSYVPPDCHPAFSVAILVTYRNRQKQLDIFLPYMHNFLRKQKIHYKIYLIEQKDEQPWNKGLLYNVGARHAVADGFPCLVLHDVDLLPRARAPYCCTRRPRHASASLDKFRFVLPYAWLVGGVLALRADLYLRVDGFSNRFRGWGGEDDDFYARLRTHNLPLIRFPRAMSRYSMLRHPPEAKNSARHRILAENLLHPQQDGYRAARPAHQRRVNHRLFTLIEVRL